MVIFKQMLIFAVIMLVGVAARKCGMITPANQKQLSSIVVNIANPMLLISGVIGTTVRLTGAEILKDFGVAAGVFAVMIGFALLVPRVIGFPKKFRGVVNLMLVFSNIGFIGIPLVSSLYGEQSIIYIMFFGIPFSLLFYTYGVRVMDSGCGSVFDPKLFLNAGLISSAVTLVLYFSGLTLPYAISESITMLSKLTSPLAMMLIGASMLDIDFKMLFTNGRLIIFAIIKMIVLPVLLLLVIKQFVYNKVMLGVCLIMLATPAGSLVAMLAGKYDKETYDLATMGVAMTTAMSVVTIPLVSFITGVG